MVHRVYPRTHARQRYSDTATRRGRQRAQQLTDGVGLLDFTSRRGAVFAVQGDIEHACAKLFDEFGLQKQTFAHARRRAAVMVANRQHPGERLGT